MKLPNITSKVKVIALMSLIQQASEAKKACENHSTKITDRAKLAFIIMSLEKAIKEEKKKPQANQNALILLQGLYEWTVETITHWKKQEWQEIEFDVWEEMINFFQSQAASFQFQTQSP